jgi:hypothetical protein
VQADYETQRRVVSLARQLIALEDVMKVRWSFKYVDEREALLQLLISTARGVARKTKSLQRQLSRDTLDDVVSIVDTANSIH